MTSAHKPGSLVCYNQACASQRSHSNGDMVFMRSSCMQVTFMKKDVTVSEILKVIQDAGFTAELLQKQDLEARQEVIGPLCATRQLDTASMRPRLHVRDHHCHGLTLEGLHGELLVGRWQDWKSLACTALPAPQLWRRHSTPQTASRKPPCRCL